MREMCQTFGITALGETVESWTLKNEFLTAEVLTYGATLRRLVFGGVDVVLGYDTLSEYERNDGYVGATVGRVCNRIGGASFGLNGVTYPLAQNDGENHLHGGARGFDKYSWAAEPLADGLRLHRLSPDGEEGYPGTLAVSVTYRLAGESLRIEYEAESDADTLCSLTNHSYFNLNGGGAAMAHTLALAAERYLETSPGCLPTGRALPVAGTPFDFRAAKAVGRDIDTAAEQLRLWAFQGMDKTYRRAISMEKRIERMRTTSKPTKARKMDARFSSAEFHGDEVLGIRNVSKSYGDKHLFEGISLKVEGGERIALLGDNGTGKSTLIGAIMGFNRYEILEGKIYFKGQDITDMSCDERARLGVGVMIQRPPTIRGLSLRKMVEICGATSEEAETMAKWMGLDNFLDRSVNDGFSGGELKRCELLQLMAQNPDLLLLDEPESGVDLENIALVGKAVNYILHTEPCGGAGCDKPCCIKNQGWENCNPLESKRSGLIITHSGHILKYVPASHAHILYEGKMTCACGDPLDVLNCIGQAGYETCVKRGKCEVKK